MVGFALALRGDGKVPLLRAMQSNDSQRKDPRSNMNSLRIFAKAGVNLSSKLLCSIIWPVVSS
jgi:hypothetical protein